MKTAAIDIGTNSTRLLVAEVDKSGALKVLHTALKTTRLGEGITRRCLNNAAMERTVEAVKQFVDYCRSADVTDIVVAATSAVRDAVNKDEFARLIKKTTGYRLKILTGEEEAKFSYQGVLAGLAGDGDGVVVIDVGGGSTEFCWIEQKQVCCASVNVGAVRMTEGDGSSDEIARLLSPVIQKVKTCPIKQLIAVGGTATTLAAVIQKLDVYNAQKVHGFKISLNQILAVLRDLETRTLEERKKMPGLQPERADIIVAGVKIIAIILKELGVNHLAVSEADILWGLAINQARDVERKTVTSYQ